MVVAGYFYVQMSIAYILERSLQIIYNSIDIYGYQRVSETLQKTNIKFIRINEDYNFSSNVHPSLFNSIHFEWWNQNC